uniref:Galactose-specific lectin nattectin-like n=1 Tax=Poecilia reticulata TaxID=8081 RepID=A0A3P9N4Y5_POERE
FRRLFLLLLSGSFSSSHLYSSCSSELVASSYSKNRSCPTGWSLYGSRCFLFQNIQKDWASAELDCIALGANLASIHSSDEHTFVKDLVNSKKGSYQRTWVGCHDGVKDGVWQWSDGSKFDYVKWGSVEPNNYGGNEDCMEINIAGSIQHMNDEKCETNRYSICAKNA